MINNNNNNNHTNTWIYEYMTIYDYIWLYMTIYDYIWLYMSAYVYVHVYVHVYTDMWIIWICLCIRICIMWLPMCFHGDDFNFDFGPARKPFLLWEIGWNTAPQVGRKSRRVDDWDYTPLILASKKSEWKLRMHMNAFCEARTHMCSTYNLPLPWWMGKICLARSCCKCSAKSEQQRKSPGPVGTSFATGWVAPSASSKSRVSWDVLRD